MSTRRGFLFAMLASPFTPVVAAPVKPENLVLSTAPVFVFTEIYNRDIQSFLKDWMQLATKDFGITRGDVDSWFASLENKETT